MSKTAENTENRLKTIFMTQDQKEYVFKKFVHKIRVKTAKLAYKRPKWSNSTKIKKRLKTSKSATKC